MDAQICLGNSTPPESKIANVIQIDRMLESGSADLLRACTLVAAVQNLEPCLSTIHFHILGSSVGYMTGFRDPSL